MYESFYELSEKPFTLIPDPDFLYLSKRHKGALNMLEFALRGQAGFTVISGEVGSGKTTVVRRFLELVDEDITIGLITNTHRSIGELLQWVLLAFGLDYTSKDKIELYNIFVDFLIEQQTAHRHPVLIIDEAQNLDVETLEELRVLSNIYDDKEHVLQIILIGQQELADKLRLPELRQLAQRVSISFQLGPLTLRETAAYIRHRLKVAGGSIELFDEETCAAVHYFSRGVPRLINILCESCLVYGFADEQRRIGIDVVLNVVSDRKDSGLSLFSSADDPLNRETILAEIGEMLSAANDESEPEEYVIPEPKNAAGRSDAPPFHANDSPDRSRAADSRRDAQESPADVVPEQQIEESSPDRLLGAGISPEFARAYREPRAQRKRIGAVTLSVAAFLVIALVSIYLGLGEHERVAEIQHTADRLYKLAKEYLSTEKLQYLEAQNRQTPQPSVIEAYVENAQKAAQDNAVEPWEQHQIAEPATIEKPIATGSDHSAELTSDQISLIDDAVIAHTEKPLPARQITLEELFDLSDPVTGRELANASLFALWNIDLAGYPGGDLCETAARSGLACLRGKENISRLWGLNRPALIALETVDGKRLDAVITSIDGSAVSLQAAGQTLVSDIGKVASLWSGDFVILWKPPSVYRRLLRKGLQGDDVAWLKNSLAKIDGTPAIDTKEAVFDSDLEERVSAFQRRHALQPDGIVGPKTMILLNTFAEVESIPVLKGPKRQRSSDS